MDINGSVNVHSQPLSALRNAPNTSNATEQANRLQKETQSVDEVTTEQPVQEAKAPSEDVVNARVSEHRELASSSQVTADEAVGSLIDVSV